MKTVFSSRRHHYIKKLGTFLVTAALIAGMAGCGTHTTPIEVRDWYDLHTARENLSGYYVLMNDLDSTIAGYTEQADSTANGGKGWQAIGTSDDPFTGSFDGQGYKINNLYINRPDEELVGLFGYVGEGGVVKNLGVVNANVTGDPVGGLMGENHGTVSNCYATGIVNGEDSVGGLVGYNAGTVSNSYSTGNVTGVDYGIGGLVGQNSGNVSNCHATSSVTGVDYGIGGLLGENWGTVSNSYATGNVTGNSHVGGLMGDNWGTVSNSYSIGNVTGNHHVGGLAGENCFGTVSNSYYNYDEVLINGENIITIGALFGADFEKWFNNDKFLDVNQKLSPVSGYYEINNVSDFKQLLAFGQDGSLKFILKSDLDLGSDPNFYIPYLAGEFDGNDHKISNLSFNFDFVSQVGLFGYLAFHGGVHDVGVENVSIIGDWAVGGLVGCNYGEGTVSDSYSTGSVTGDEYVGGLVGDDRSDASNSVSKSYSSADVAGEWGVGGLVGANLAGTVSNSYATGSVTGNYSVGGLVGENWGTVSDSYATGSVTGIEDVGGLVGENTGTVSNSYATGSVSSGTHVGGLVGYNQDGTVSHSFWDTETSGKDNSDGGEGKITTQMKDIATFLGIGWDIVLIGNYVDETWYIDDGTDYPRLGWQY